MVKNDIISRENLYLLVSTFYEKIRNDAVLGPIFNTKIDDWEAHFQHLTTFWESSLFITRKIENKYLGNPIEKHIAVDNENNNNITELHFGIWLNYWVQTIDALFAGEVADNAKRRARKMGTFLYLKIFEARSKNRS